MGELYQIMNFICFVMGQFFDILDSVYLGGYTILNIQLAFAFFGITIWFLLRVMDNKEGESNE